MPVLATLVGVASSSLFSLERLCTVEDPLIGREVELLSVDGVGLGSSGLITISRLSLTGDSCGSIKHIETRLKVHVVLKKVRNYNTLELRFTMYQTTYLVYE